MAVDLEAEQSCSRPVLLLVVVLAAFFCRIDALAQAVRTPDASAVSRSINGDVLQSMSEMNFDVKTMKQGLPHDSAYWVTQDTTGYIWIATFGGLSRYDGYQFRNYTHDSAVASSLPDNNIRVVMPKSHGDLYVGTGSAGLAIYSAASDSFSVPAKTPNEVKKARIFALSPDGEDGAWFGMQDGMGHYRAGTGDVEVFGKIGGRGGDHGFPIGNVYSIFQDGNGDLWIGTSGGLYRRRSGSPNFQHIPGLLGPGELGEQTPVWVIFKASDGKLWIGTDEKGIGVYDPDADVIRGVAKISGESSAFGPHTMRGILEIEPGVFWVATYGAGLFSYNTKTQAVLHWAKDPTAAAPLSSDFVRSLFRDKSGVVWAGTDNGLSSISGTSRGISNILTSPLRPDRLFGTEVRSVASGFGRVWVGFDQGGVAEIDADGSIHRIQPAPGLRSDQISHREILALKVMDDNTVIAGGVGLYSIDVRSRTYRPINHPELDRQLFNAVYVDGDDIWAGRYTGLVRYNRKTHQAKVFVNKPGDNTSISDNYVRDMLKDSHGRFWITTRLGLDLFDPETDTFRHLRHDPQDPASLTSDNVQPICEDARGRLWIGSIGAGIAILEDWPANGKPRFRTIDHQHNGIPDDIILVIRRGLDGAMWVNTPRGLAVIDPSTFGLKVYGASDGLQTTAQNLFSSALLNDGTVLFPGSASVVVVRPTRLHSWTVQAPLTITGVKIQGVDSSAVQLAAQASNGSLNFPAHRGFEIGFSLLDFSAPAETLYSYQLEGFDDAWTKPTLSNRSATYTNLPGGSYVFHVRATSRSGSGPTAEISVPIHVNESLFERWWFQALITLVIVAIVIFLVRLRLVYMARRQHELEAEVAARTAELEQSRQELMEANQRLEKLALHDPLTGSLNRRGFFDRSAVERARAMRSEQPFSLLLADLDNFKQTNDTMGHGVGDAVLRAVAQLLSGSLRGADVFARYGGEEFVMLLPETDENSAYQLAERLRKLVEEYIIEYAGLAFKTTTSIGLATCSAPDEPLDALLARADHALYRAKHSGKNCVRVASSDEV